MARPDRDPAVGCYLNTSTWRMDRVAPGAFVTDANASNGSRNGFTSVS